jgi:hypothetical protein
LLVVDMFVCVVAACVRVKRVPQFIDVGHEPQHGPGGNQIFREPISLSFTCPFAVISQQWTNLLSALIRMIHYVHVGNSIASDLLATPFISTATGQQSDLLDKWIRKWLHWPNDKNNQDPQIGRLMKMMTLHGHCRPQIKLAAKRISNNKKIQLVVPDYDEDQAKIVQLPLKHCLLEGPPCN